MGGDVKGTGIPSLAFTLSMTVRLRGAFSVAQKMSWASKRETTHTEDISYCLLGIKGVHMPLLYGEGANAFLRLQEEIMKVGRSNNFCLAIRYKIFHQRWSEIAPGPYSRGIRESGQRFLSESARMGRWIWPLVSHQ